MIRAHHDGKRLFDPAQAPLQFIHGIFDTGNMESSEPPDRKNASCIEQFCGLLYWIETLHLVSACIDQGEVRPAGSAGDRLCMVAPACRDRHIPVHSPGTGGILPSMCAPGRRGSPDDAVPGPAVHAGRGPVILRISRLL